MTLRIDLNCDLGEDVLVDRLPVELLIMPFISSANVACGRHAGNLASMRQTLQLARKHHVAVGVHPSYDDRLNFGRMSVKMTKAGLKNLLKAQILDLSKIAIDEGIVIQHLKPHGALYNDAMIQQEAADAIAETVAEILPHAHIFGLPDSCMQNACKKTGVAFAAEAFADRAYDADGRLVARNKEGSLIHHTTEVIERCLLMVLENRIVSIDGKNIYFKPDTICLHGDGPNAPALSKALREALEEHHILVKPYAAI